MSAMDKMWLSLVAILIMGLSVFLITFARAKTKGFVRVVFFQSLHFNYAHRILVESLL